ncbi:MAG: spore protease YyaC [Clostridiales bacterium]|jgi:putative sporulation protein YyaC|nr:spore protease YyaC [Clostridiales bacterium]
MTERKKTGLPVIMCIGSDKVSGDILGPEVGRRLISDYNLGAYVYGITGRNINGENIDSYDSFIREVHKDSAVIAVDACLGGEKEIGNIKISKRGIGAGFAVGKKDKRYGDVGLVGIVGKISDDNVMQLISADCGLVEALSGKIAEYLADNMEKILRAD